MNMSGILVVVSPDNFAASVDDLNHMDGIDVYHSDPETGRIVVVQEAENVGAEIQGLKRLKKLPYVRLAEMVYHYVAEDNEILDACSIDFEQMSDELKVPAYLNN